jgi:sulfur-carrier protein adenylyltransferase/sulfurtransferase
MKQLTSNKLKICLQSSIILIAIAAGILATINYNPYLLKPLIKSGLPLNYLSGLPILGDAVRSAETPQISVQELKKLIDSKVTDFFLVDVREPEEYDTAHIPDAVLVPLTDIQKGIGVTKIKSLIVGKKLITYCSVGKRSHRALELLRKTGIEGKNVSGGIEEWREKIDQSMPEI